MLDRAVIPRLAAMVALCFLLVGCGVPVPEDRIAYVGEWRGAGMSLVITADGGVAYKRTSGNGNTSINMPLQGFEGDDFLVGMSRSISTLFRVTKPPYQEDGIWKMVVDGVALTKVRYKDPVPRKDI